MIGQECIDELADFVGLEEPRSPRSPSGPCAARSPSSRRCASAWRCSKGLPVGVVDAVIDERITLKPGARTLVQTMRANGAYAAPGLGRLPLFTGRDRRRGSAFDEHRANRLVIEGGG